MVIYVTMNSRGRLSMIEMLRKRRSVRKFQKKGIEEEMVKILQEALLRTPSSRSINPWEFIFVDDRETLKKLALSKKHGSAFLEGAAMAVVVMGDREKSDTCVEDCSIAAITLQYVAESSGLGSCWCQIRLRPHDDEKDAERYVRDILDIPERYLIECIVGIGYPAESKPPHSPGEFDGGKIHRGKF